MKNIAASTGWNNTSSSSTLDLPYKPEGIVVCIAFAIEAVLIVVGNLLTIVLFAVNKKLRKKSMFLVINMTFADVLCGAVSLPLYVYSFVGPHYQLWTNVYMVQIVFSISDSIFSLASLISAVFISCERFFAVYWPLKHRTVSMPAYRILICMLWALAILVTTVFNLPHLTSNKIAFSVYISFPLIFLFVVCGCNVGIWKKFQHENIASQQQNRASQNQRLTKTLLFVSAIAVLSWLPLIIANYYELSIRLSLLFYFILAILNFSNSFVNPIVYALKIPEFKKALGLLCLRRQAVMNSGAIERRNNRATALTPVMQLRTLPTDHFHPQLAFEQEVMDTRL